MLHITPRRLLGVLVVTYLIWAAGMRFNVQANWCLLEDTGTSTNAMSKGLFDLCGTDRAPARPAYGVGGRVHRT